MFHVLNDPAHDCEPLAELKMLIRAGQMPHVVTLWGLLPGDCGLIVAAFMADIAAARLLRFRWQPVAGDCTRNNLGWHHWVESDNWAFDLSNGDRRPAIVMRAGAYAAMRGVASIIDAPGRGDQSLPLGEPRSAGIVARRVSLEYL
jgi:hypothetical protein